MKVWVYKEFRGRQPIVTKTIKSKSKAFDFARARFKELGGEISPTSPDTLNEATNKMWGFVVRENTTINLDCYEVE
ncbi:MAG: hypothetical protein J5725_13310 [Bacteroidales bacterium]|nr:hypothetical protein [Bacteroidales bacterium]